MGPGGSGKTRLALEAARWQLDRFANGVWLVELDSLTEPALVPQAVATVLEVREVPATALMDTLVRYLQGRSLLLVLDNREHLAQACADLAQSVLRTFPGACILGTSREPLRVEGEVTWPVEPLSVPEVADRSSAARAYIGFCLGRVEEAAARVTRILDWCPATDKATRAMTLGLFAAITLMRGDGERAGEWAQQAVAAGRESGDPEALFIALTAIATWESARGNHPAALALVRENLTVVTDAELWWQVHTVIDQAAMVLVAAGRIHPAVNLMGALHAFRTALTPGGSPFNRPCTSRR